MSEQRRYLVKLTEEDAREIVRRAKSMETITSIAKAFGISRQRVYEIRDDPRFAVPDSSPPDASTITGA